MPLQDLTPQLRTRLNKMERAVGWFVFFAAVLLLFGFGYYIYHTAERKGWFLAKARFATYLQTSTGLKVGDPVFMKGFQVGSITRVHPRPPGDRHNVEVQFQVLEPYFRYIWTGGSHVKVNAGFLGQSQLEVTRATNGYALCVTQPIFQKTIPELEKLILAESNQWQLSQYVFDAKSNILFRPYAELSPASLQTLAALNLESNSVFAYNNTINRKHIVAVWREELQRYDFYNPENNSPVELSAAEALPVADRLDRLVGQVEVALPGILSLTNKLAAVLDNAANATANLNSAIVAAQPLVTNFTAISGELRGPGALGVWALGTNAPFQIESVLTNANTLLVNVDTNLNQLTADITLTLLNLASITSNLNAQVQANPNLLGTIGKTIADTDDMVQGLKRHWLLRSAFKVKTTNAPAVTAPVKKLTSPRGAGQ